MNNRTKTAFMCDAFLFFVLGRPIYPQNISRLAGDRDANPAGDRGGWKITSARDLDVFSAHRVQPSFRSSIGTEYSVYTRRSAIYAVMSLYKSFILTERLEPTTLPPFDSINTYICMAYFDL